MSPKSSSPPMDKSGSLASSSASGLKDTMSTGGRTSLNALRSMALLQDLQQYVQGVESEAASCRHQVRLLGAYNLIHQSSSPILIIEWFHVCACGVDRYRPQAAPTPDANVLHCPPSFVVIS